MASLTIRKLPDDIKQDLRELAARNGRSLEEEARRALIALVKPENKPPRKSFFQGLYEISRPGFELPSRLAPALAFRTLEANDFGRYKCLE